MSTFPTEVLKLYSLNPLEEDTLKLLHEQPLTYSGAATMLEVSYASARRHILSLEKKDLLIRSRRRFDEGYKFVSITHADPGSLEGFKAVEFEEESVSAATVKAVLFPEALSLQELVAFGDGMHVRIKRANLPLIGLAHIYMNAAARQEGLKPKLPFASDIRTMLVESSNFFRAMADTLAAVARLGIYSDEPASLVMQTFGKDAEPLAMAKWQQIFLNHLEAGAVGPNMYDTLPMELLKQSIQHVVDQYADEPETVNEDE